MIGKYLSNTNENTTVPVLQNFLELNKALVLVLYKYAGGWIQAFSTLP